MTHPTTYRELHEKAMDLMAEMLEVDPDIDPVITILLANYIQKLSAAMRTKP